MSNKNKRRINLILSPGLVEIIDEFAALTRRSRSHICEELLTPSIPALEELLLTAKELASTPEVERYKRLQQLDDLEVKLTRNAKAIPKAIEKI